MLAFSLNENSSTFLLHSISFIKVIWIVHAWIYLHADGDQSVCMFNVQVGNAYMGITQLLGSVIAWLSEYTGI